MTKTAELTPPARNAAAPHPVPSRSRDNCHIWKAPSSREDWLNSLHDTYASLPAGMTLVYRRGLPGHLTKMPPLENHVAVSVAARLGGALVQWPEGPSHGDQRKVRTWCYGIQKRGAA